MNENAKKWVAALRSGKYKQARQKLRLFRDEIPDTAEADRSKTKIVDDKAEVGYCCLGVGIDLYIEAHPEDNLEWYDYESGWDEDGYDAGWDDEELPRQVRDWLGLKTQSGNYNGKNLVTDND